MPRKQHIAGALCAVLAIATGLCVALAAEPVTVASFNVKWIGYYAERDDKALADLLAPFDIVVIQELVSPPYPAVYPDGKPVKPDDQAKEFFDAMAAKKFRYVLSPEDTGTGIKNHTNSASTEWFAAFYKPARICATGDRHPDEACVADGLPAGFLAKDHTAHPDWERVPYAFGFRVAGGPDFVLISVHLQPGSASKARKRRKHELRAIGRWIDEHDDGPERDFIILGDMNIDNCEELAQATPKDFVSLNDECRNTSTAPPDRPYDHVMYRPETSKEIDEEFDLAVIDLVKTMKPEWSGPGKYPGKPYKSKIFPKYYSDHHPIHFRIKTEGDDD